MSRETRSEAQGSLKLPAGLDYSHVRGLSREVQQKLNCHKPESIGQAARVQGVTPAAISLLLVHLKRGFSQRGLQELPTPGAGDPSGPQQKKSA